MCGITGQINTLTAVNKHTFELMLKTLEHRGPDGSGTYYHSNEKVALGHSRLSFLDLSDAGKQPMCDNTQKVWITFNGEIYNYLELKNELKNEYQFITGSDTEVMLAAYRKWGIAFVNKLKGMFAFALFDEQAQKMFLVRDRFGIKPLYYFKNDNCIAFASELKAILASGIVPKNIDYTAFADYFVYRYIPSPKTIWQNIHKVPPACYVEINTQNLQHTQTEYWQLVEGNNDANEDELIEDVNKLLTNSVMQHTRADVPLGSFLSGGYDSSALAHYMKKLGLNPQTFSIGFANWANSEDKFANIVAAHLQLKNTAVVADESSLKLVDKMAMVYDEPIADISIVPTYMVSQLAKKQVKAVLSGEGADEIFAGYTWQHQFMQKQKNTHWLKRLFSRNNMVDFYANAMSMGLFDHAELKKMLNPNLHQYINDDVNWFYRKHYNPKLNPLKAIQYLDIKCFMGELVLTKIDRASMANSLEVRVPFLDHTLIEKIFATNPKYYYKPEQTKWLLYKNINMYLPKQILNRKKQGFVGPDNYYMDLGFYQTQLAESYLVKHGIINQSYIDNLLKEKYNWKLWKILIMEKWFKQWID